MVTKKEKVLISAFKRWPEEPFTAEDLVVACWTDFPDDFGLQGYQQSYPDANVVYRHIMGQGSIVKKQKWLLQTERKTYRISMQGIAHALMLVEDSPGDGNAQRLRIDRSREGVLVRMLRSRAWHKYQTGDPVVFREACAFWGIIPRSANDEYRFARKELEDSLTAAQERIIQYQGIGRLILDGNVSVHAEDLLALRQLDDHLVDTFADEIAAINARIIDRGRVKQT